jgi:YD repeat-containing protein
MRVKNLLLSFLCMILLSCTKQQDNRPNTSTQLTSTQTYWGDSIYYRTFQYDAQGRLVKIVDSINFPNWTPQVSVLTYNTANQLQKISVTTYFSSYDMKFYYNSNNQVILRKDSLTSQPNTWHSNTTFAYDAQGRIIADTLKDANSFQSATNYTYNQNDNITSSQYSYWNYATNSIQTYPGPTNTYGTELNPYDSIGKILYYLEKDPQYLNKNMLLSVQQGQYNVDYSYQLNSAGQLIKSIMNNNSFSSPYNLFTTVFNY